MSAHMITAVVAVVSPLTLTIDGDPAGVTVPAYALSGYTPVAGDRVRVELRTPLPPFVLGRV